MLAGVILYIDTLYVVSFHPTLCGQFKTHEAGVSMGGCELYMFSNPSPSSFLQK